MILKYQEKKNEKLLTNIHKFKKRLGIVVKIAIKEVR
jgi:hypothetical protein